MTVIGRWLQHLCVDDIARHVVGGGLLWFVVCVFGRLVVIVRLLYGVYLEKWCVAKQALFIK